MEGPSFHPLRQTDQAGPGGSQSDHPRRFEVFVRTLVPRYFGTKKEVARAMGVQEPTFYRYLRTAGTRTPSWLSITRLAVIVAEKEPSLDAATLAADWLEQLHIAPESQSEVQQEVRRLTAPRRVEPDVWDRMQLCRHSQSLGKSAVQKFMKRQDGNVIAAFIWRWLPFQTRDRILRADTVDFFNKVVLDRQSGVDVWACFVAGHQDAKRAEHDLTSAFADLAEHADVKWSPEQFDDAVRVYLLTRDSYRHVCDYWFHLGRSQAEQDSLGLVVYTDQELETQAASLTETENQTWEYSAQVVVLDGEQSRTTRDYFGIRFAGAKARPRWSHEETQFRWSRVCLTNFSQEDSQ